jgi:asparagine synthase (glutamine-hydrolysing)
MAHGLEVRVPLLDHRIAELSLSLPSQLIDAERAGGKPLLRRLAQSRLPPTLVQKRKQGFSFPVDRLISIAEMTQTIAEGSLLRSGVIDRKGWQRWLVASPASQRQLQLWQLFVFEHWAVRWMPGLVHSR